MFDYKTELNQISHTKQLNTTLQKHLITPTDRIYCRDMFVVINIISFNALCVMFLHSTFNFWLGIISLLALCWASFSLFFYKMQLNRVTEVPQIAKA